MASAAAALEVALVTAQDRSLAAAQDRVLGDGVQGEAWAGLAQGPLGMVDRRATQRVGFLQEVGTFHRVEPPAAGEGADQSPLEAPEGKHPQGRQGTGSVARWLLQMSRTCWQPGSTQTIDSDLRCPVLA